MPPEPSPLTKLIVDACKAKGWRPADLHAAMVARGATLKPQTVYVWWKGGGMRDAHRVVLAEVLGLDLNDVLRAAAGVRGAA
jgi:hypothetical protein